MCSSPSTASACPARRCASCRATPDAIPTGGGTGGARSLYSEGQAILLTAATVIERGRKAASEALEAAPGDIVFEEGRFSDHRHRSRHGHILALAGHQLARLAKGEDVTTLDAAEVAEIKSHTFPNGCHIAEVEIDPDTGHIFVVMRYIVCDDVGKAVNPMIVARPGAWRRRPGATARQ